MVEMACKKKHDCVSIGELAFLLTGSTETGLGQVSFVVFEPVTVVETFGGRKQLLTGLRDTRGLFHGYDNNDSRFKLLKQFHSGDSFAIQGRLQIGLLAMKLIGRSITCYSKSSIVRSWIGRLVALLRNIHLERSTCNDAR